MSGNETFLHLWERLELLERWLELAIRPDTDQCPDDVDLLHEEIDNIRGIYDRCLAVRCEMNKYIPHDLSLFDDELSARPSTIQGAGIGLFFDGPEAVGSGEILCYYTGHIHNYHSAKVLDDVSYLMHVQGNLLIDAKPLLHMKARYINDPLNDDRVNARFIPDGIRVAVVSTRTIHPGEEIFASYGDAYWAQHKQPGRMKR